MVCNTWMAEPGTGSPFPWLIVSPSLCTERTEQLFVPSTVCKVTHPSYPVPGGEGGRVVPVVRVSDFSSVKQITLVVAARGCYRSHSAVELGRINEHHPQSPALTVGKSFLGSQPTFWSLLLEDPHPGDAQMPHLDLTNSCSENSCKGPQPGQGCCAEPSSGELLPFAPAGSLWGRIPQLQWKHNTRCCCLGGAKHWCRRAGGMAGGGQPAVGSSFLALVFVGGLAPALCGQRMNALLAAQGSRTDPSACPTAAGASWAQSGTTT